MENFSRIIAGIIAAVALTIVPVYYLACQFDENTQRFVYQATSRLADRVKEESALTQLDWAEFITCLDSTGNVYKVDVKVFKPAVDGEFELGAAVGTAKRGFNLVDMDELLDSVYGIDRKFVLEEGDYFCVSVASDNKTLAQNLKLDFLGAFSRKGIEASAGCAIWEVDK